MRYRCCFAAPPDSVVTPITDGWFPRNAAVHDTAVQDDAESMTVADAKTPMPSR